ncbi:peptidase S8/S53 domain-containing protein [Mycena rebaudengoi]|nr:peptidase S8/S53 domain-containing protein [Mycena rebaudengoi]
MLVSTLFQLSSIAFWRLSAHAVPVHDPHPDHGRADILPGIHTPNLTSHTVVPRRSGATWNLARITQDGPVQLGHTGSSSQSTDWTFWIDEEASGENVVVYVVDTGTNEDVDGHGTAVASVVAGTTVGVANKASVVSIKVLNQWTDLVDDTVYPQDMPTATIVKGLQNAMNHYKKERGGKGGAVINISLFPLSGTSEPLQQAFQQAISMGMHIVVAAGNDKEDQCCETIPDLGQISVGATNIEDKKADFSNFGPCVDLYAPGESILAARIDSQVLGPMDGTSFAAPMISGMIATIISKSGNLSPTKMKQKIIADAGNGSVVDLAQYLNSNNYLGRLDPTLRNLIEI